MQSNNQTLTVVGELVPSEEYDINADTRRVLHEIMMMAGLGGLILRETIETGVIRINKSLFVSHLQAPMSFIRKFQEVVNNPTLIPYGFTGKISVVLFGTELVAYNVILTKGRLTYQKAQVQWNHKPTPLNVAADSTFAK